MKKITDLTISYDRNNLMQGILHLGVGNFHRAHQACYYHQLLLAGDKRWGIYGVGILDEDRLLHQRLAQQNYLYTLIQQDDHSQKTELVGSLLSCQLLSEKRHEIIAKIADPSVKTITLTVSEGGYRIQDLSGEFELEHPDIVRDLEQPQKPSTLHGLLYAGLKLRLANNVKPPNILSCDNVAGNSLVLRKGLLSYAQTLDQNFAQWITDNVAFPCSMVDRITPRTPETAAALWKNKLGYLDEAMVFCEPFRLWLIEKNFCNEFPDVSACEGVYFVDDVLPFERMKMFLLNAAHQALAHLAALAGYEDFALFVQQPAVENFLRYLLEKEARPVVGDVALLSVDEFINNTIQRFKNSKLGDTVTRLTAISSNCYAKFIMPTLQATAQEKNELCPGFCLSIAAWFEYLYQAHYKAKTLEDPLAPKMMKFAAEAEKNGDYHIFFKEFTDIFFTDIVSHPQWGQLLKDNLTQLRKYGVIETLKKFQQLTVG